MSSQYETDVSIHEDFAERFKSIFSDLNNTQIAEKLGLTHVAVQNYVKGRRLPTADVLMRISNVTSVSIDWLLTGQGEQFLATKVEFDEVNQKKIIIENVIDRLLDLIKYLKSKKLLDKKSFLVACESPTNVKILKRGSFFKEMIDSVVNETNISLEYLLYGTGNKFTQVNSALDIPRNFEPIKTDFEYSDTRIPSLATQLFNLRNSVIKKQKEDDLIQDDDAIRDIVKDETLREVIRDVIREEFSDKTASPSFTIGKPSINEDKKVA